MITAIAKLTSKGRLTLPADVREHLGVSKGDVVEFVIGDGGAVHVQRVRYSTIDSLAGCAGTLGREMTWHEMREIAREDALLPKWLDSDLR